MKIPEKIDWEDLKNIAQAQCFGCYQGSSTCNKFIKKGHKYCSWCKQLVKEIEKELK